MFLALTSLLTERTVRSDTAMTGEISLRGLVLPIGGVKEKVLAAVRAGITTVMLPARNRKDLEDVPEARASSCNSSGSSGSTMPWPRRWIPGGNATPPRLRVTRQYPTGGRPRTRPSRCVGRMAAVGSWETPAILMTVRAHPATTDSCCTYREAAEALTRHNDQTGDGHAFSP
jgi:hypothetical protein